MRQNRNITKGFLLLSSALLLLLLSSGAQARSCTWVFWTQVCCGGEGDIPCLLGGCDAGLALNPDTLYTSCTVCGGEGEASCGGFCDAGNTLDANTIYTTCTACGSEGEPTCVNLIDPLCESGLAGNPATLYTTCTACGASGQPICPDLLKPCDPGSTLDPANAFLTCTACGGEGELLCADLDIYTPECEPGLTIDPANLFLTCTACGGHGQPICPNLISQCDSGLIVNPGNLLYCTACDGVAQPSCGCGGEGERTCINLNIFTPLCDPGLTTDPATLLTTCTSCGSSGQPICPNLLAPCDPGLVLDINNLLYCASCGEAGQVGCTDDPLTACNQGLRAHRRTLLDTFYTCHETGYAENQPTTNSDGCPIGSINCDETTPLSVPKQTPDEAVWGWADVHEHMFANEAYGGALIWGKPFDIGIDGRSDVNLALAWCDYTWEFETAPPLLLALDPAFYFDGILGVGGANWDGRGYPVHGTNWVTAISLIPTQTTYGFNINAATRDNPVAFHDVSGIDGLHGWPHFLDGGHQQMYYKWVERAYEGGLRLLLDMPVNNSFICEISIKQIGVNDSGVEEVYSCADMLTVERQIKQMKALENYIDRIDDGTVNDSGWYRIAYSPQEAREIIEDGAMAVIIGMEIDKLFECGQLEGVFDDDCWDPVKLRAKIDEVWGWGVRHLYPVHLTNNAFAGTAVYSTLFYWPDLLGDILTPLISYDCINAEQKGVSAEGDPNSAPAGYTFKLTIDDPALGTGIKIPFTTFGADCNHHGLTPGGVSLITQLMDRGMIIDIDHFSHRALEGYFDILWGDMPGVLDILEDNAYPPLSSHSVVTPDGGAVTEYGHTESRARRVLKMGGMFTTNPPRRHGNEVDELDDPGTSRQFVHGQHLHGGSSLGYIDIYRLAQEAISANNEGKKPWDSDWLDPDYPRIALTGDHGAFLNAPGPRFKKDGAGYEALYQGIDIDVAAILAQPECLLLTDDLQRPENCKLADTCTGDEPHTKCTADTVPALSYPFDSFEVKSDGGGTGKFHKQVTGSRTYDFNTDGLAHYGLIPDMLADISNVLDQARTDNTDADVVVPDMTPLLHSAEAFLRMWEQIPAFAPPPPPDQDNDGVPDEYDNCPDITNAEQTDSDADGVGDACEIVKCDVDTDGDIDISDIRAIFGARRQTVPPASPLMDFDDNGVISVTDGRSCILICTNPRCAP